MRRVVFVLAVVTPLVMPVSFVGLFSAPAGAQSSNSFNYCDKVSGNFNGTITFKKCEQPPPPGYGTLSTIGTELTRGGSLTWKNGDAFSFSPPGPFANMGQGLCRKHWTEGSQVLEIQSASGSYDGDPISLYILLCLSTTGKVKAAPGNATISTKGPGGPG
jgi:hypothetical protein